MNLDLKASISAGVEMRDAHLLQLAVARLNPLPVAPQIHLIAPGVRRHLLAPRRDQPHARLFQYGRGIIACNVTLVAIKTRRSGRTKASSWSGERS